MSLPGIPPHVGLGALAVVLATGAVAVDLVAPRSGAGAVARITPIELARRIRAADPGLDLVDVRTTSEYDAGHIPTARSAPLDEFTGEVEGAAGTMVLYSADESAAVAAALRTDTAAPGTSVFVLERGIHGWLDDIMAVRIPRDATASERAAFEARSEMSRWFGGVPRVVDTVADRPGLTEERSRRLLGGC